MQKSQGHKPWLFLFRHAVFQKVTAYQLNYLSEIGFTLR